MLDSSNMCTGRTLLICPCTETRRQRPGPLPPLLPHSRRLRDHPQPAELSRSLRLWGIVHLMKLSTKINVSRVPNSYKSYLLNSRYFTLFLVRILSPYPVHNSYFSLSLSTLYYLLKQSILLNLHSLNLINEQQLNSFQFSFTLRTRYSIYTTGTLNLIYLYSFKHSFLYFGVLGFISVTSMTYSLLKALRQTTMQPLLITSAIPTGAPTIL